MSAPSHRWRAYGLTNIDDVIFNSMLKDKLATDIQSMICIFFTTYKELGYTVDASSPTTKPQSCVPFLVLCFWCGIASALCHTKLSREHHTCTKTRWKQDAWASADRSIERCAGNELLCVPMHLASLDQTSRGKSPLRLWWKVREVSSKFLRIQV